MEAPSPSYIITRALFVIGLIVAVLSGVSFYKKKQRQAAIIADLKSISSDSSFFQQFYTADAQKALVRAIALIADANQLGIPPESSIDLSVGIEPKGFMAETRTEEPTLRQEIVRANLRANYQNFLKLGYQPDFQTLKTMKEGTLPPIPGGPEAGKRPVVATLIDPSLSPGIDKVIANLELRPPAREGTVPSDVELASAKRLASDLADAHVIESTVRDKILKGLSPATH